MALQDKKIMPPLWLAFREIERYSIGWRMGYGEDYRYRFGDWLDTLSPEEQAEYRALFPREWSSCQVCSINNVAHKLQEFWNI